MTNFTPIPNEVFESSEYKHLRFGDRAMLLELYHQYSDCERFTVVTENREAHMKLSRLIKAGFLVVVGGGYMKTQVGQKPRIFEFKHSALEAYAG